MNPLTGRFRSADSYEGENSDPIGLHKYLYGNADTVGHIDPSGNLREEKKGSELSIDTGRDFARLLETHGKASENRISRRYLSRARSR